MTRGYSTDGYRGLIGSAAAAGFAFRRFNEAPEGRSLYLRHDVDFSLPLAVELARINSSLGVRGTFFVLLRSQAYNLLAHRSLAHVRELVRLGQDVALHYSLPDPLPAADVDLAAAIRADFDLLCEHVPEATAAFAWHNPSKELLDRGLDLAVPGLVNVYGRRLFREVPYRSDSVMRRTIEDLEQTVLEEDHRVLQLLLHPLYWVIGGRSAAEVLVRTWELLIREQEREMTFNAEWVARMPAGIPEPLIAAFISGMLSAIHADHPPQG